jgi:hypothetical protein
MEMGVIILKVVILEVIKVEILILIQGVDLKNLNDVHSNIIQI